jgi:hypothetical protein
MDKIKCSRIYADAQGESHFGEVEMDLKPLDCSPWASPMDVSSIVPAGSWLFASAPPGWVADWHTAPCRQLAVVLSGELELRVSDGEVRRLGRGDYCLAEDTTGKGHHGRVLSASEVIWLFVNPPG